MSDRDRDDHQVELDRASVWDMDEVTVSTHESVEAFMEEFDDDIVDAEVVDAEVVDEGDDDWDFQ